MMKKPFYQLAQKQDLIRHFTPNWFTVVMGTGILAVILPEFPFAKHLMWQLGASLWHLNTLLFLVFSALYAARWLLYPQEAKQIFNHPVMCLFLGAIPMALAAVLNGLLKFGLPLYGEAVLNLAEYLWYADALLALVIAWAVPFLMYSRQQHVLHSMTAVWLLPIVACEVAAASGALLLQHLPAAMQSVYILLSCYVLWGISVLPAFAVLTILMLRLALHQLPSKDMAISSWLALGPIGTGALALLLLGAEAPRILAHSAWGAAGMFLQQAGFLAALMLIGFGLWWLGIAVLTSLKHAAADLPFNLGWWGLTFPLGVFTLAVLNLAVQTQLPAIYGFAYILAAVLALLWGIVLSKTVKGFYQGQLIVSPCLKAYLEHRAD